MFQNLCVTANFTSCWFKWQSNSWKRIEWKGKSYNIWFLQHNPTNILENVSYFHQKLDFSRKSGQIEITFLNHQPDAKAKTCKVKFIPVMVLRRPWVKGFITKKKAIHVCSPVTLHEKSKYFNCKTSSIINILSRGTVFNESALCNSNPKTEAFTTSQGSRIHTFNFSHLIILISTVFYTFKLI